MLIFTFVSLQTEGSKTVLMGLKSPQGLFQMGQKIELSNKGVRHINEKNSRIDFKKLAKKENQRPVGPQWHRGANLKSKNLNHFLKESKIIVKFFVNNDIIYFLIKIETFGLHETILK